MTDDGANLPQGNARLSDLKRKLRARKGMREYVENCKALEAEIARLENK